MGSGCLSKPRPHVGNRPTGCTPTVPITSSDECNNNDFAKYMLYNFVNGAHTENSGSGVFEGMRCAQLCTLSCRVVWFSEGSKY